MSKVRKWLCAFAAFICSASGIFWGSQRFLKVTYETIEIRSLPKELQGLRILHISDVHARSPEEIGLNIWERAQKLDFDIVAITGDIVDKSAYQLEPHIPYIESVAAEYPVVFCEGNHDHYSMSKLRPALEGAGVTVLVDEKTQLKINGATIEVIGISDYYTANIEIQKELFTASATKKDKLQLVLSHQPQHIDLLPIDENALVLAGHTHGGQWRLPFFPTIYAPGQGFFPKYGYGVYELGNGRMHVSRGISSTGKAPFRIWNRPEMCVIELVRAEESL